jgi:hypothetical protein
LQFLKIKNQQETFDSYYIIQGALEEKLFYKQNPN